MVRPISSRARQRLNARIAAAKEKLNIINTKLEPPSMKENLSFDRPMLEDKHRKFLRSRAGRRLLAQQKRLKARIDHFTANRMLKQKAPSSTVRRGKLASA